MPGAMPLHEAIETVLHNSGRAMHADDVAAEINRRELYERGDSQPLDGAQARARGAKAEYCAASSSKRASSASREARTARVSCLVTLRGGRHMPIVADFSPLQLLASTSSSGSTAARR